MVEVVIDVNVLVSTTLSGTGASAQLIEALRGGRLTAVASDKLITELGDVLRRGPFRRYLSLDEVEEYATEIGGLCRPADDPDEVPEVVRDPDDDYRSGRGKPIDFSPSKTVRASMRTNYFVSH